MRYVNTQHTTTTKAFIFSSMTLSSFAASAQCTANPTPIYDTFSSFETFHQHWWIAENQPMPGTNNPGLFKVSQVDFVEKKNRNLVKITMNDMLSGEIRTQRSDLHYGQYRFDVKLPKFNKYSGSEGSVTGLFTYRNYVNEIDIEYVTHKGTEPVNKDEIQLVTHTPANPNYIIEATLNKECKKRCVLSFDWHPTHLEFYVNGIFLHGIYDPALVPQLPSSLHANLWAGIQTWGGDFPQKASKLKIFDITYEPWYAC